MIRIAAFVFAVAASATLANGRFEVDRFDMTGDLPAGFAIGVPSQNFDGFTYDSLNGDAQLVIFGGHVVFSRLAEHREVTRQGLLFNQSSITSKFVDDNSYAYSGMRANGDIYYLYTRLGATCEGDPVLGSFVLAYDAASPAIYEAMIAPLIDSFHIGACG